MIAKRDEWEGREVVLSPRPCPQLSTGWREKTESLFSALEEEASARKVWDLLGLV